MVQGPLPREWSCPKWAGSSTSVIFVKTLLHKPIPCNGFLIKSLFPGESRLWRQGEKANRRGLEEKKCHSEISYFVQGVSAE